ncbi:MAG: hypothetical protein KBI47_11355 [Armatimonadetes bacterium]|jgi:hypothetical protein|nr:hypothetical protein [Armatimonadota bacterium]
MHDLREANPGYVSPSLDPSGLPITEASQQPFPAPAVKEECWGVPNL